MGGVKNHIIDAISDTSDSNLRAVLLLMLQVLDEIGTKIDRMANDEEAIRNVVLEAHADDHNKHHEWIRDKIHHEIHTAEQHQNKQVDLFYSTVEKVLWVAVGVIISKWSAISDGLSKILG